LLAACALGSDVIDISMVKNRTAKTLMRFMVEDCIHHLN